MLKIATWNINSVRLRLDLVLKFLKENDVDVLCLQETKCPIGQFPSARLREAGYDYVAENGQAGYHGVAIVSRLPLEEITSRRFCRKDDARHVSARIARNSGILLHNFYVPAGGDIPDPEVNAKFAHKLAFMDELTRWFGGRGPHRDGAVVLVGDLNVAPFENDVWSHKQLLSVVSHTPLETKRLLRLLKASDLVDAMRHRVPMDQKLYTWWSYRAHDWRLSNRGRRLDHVWLDRKLNGRCGGIEVMSEVRGWQRSSDHVPVVASIDD